MQDAQASQQPGSVPDPSLGGASPSPAGPGQGGATGQATPEEQDNKDRIVLAASKMLYNEKMTDKFMKTLSAGGENPSASIATVAATLIGEVDKQSKGQLPVDMIIPATQEILEMIGEMGETAGLYEYDDKMAARASSEVIEMLGTQYGVDAEDIQAMMDAAGPDQVQSMTAQHQGLVGEEVQGG